MDDPESHASAATRGFFGRDLIYVAFWALQMALTVLLTPIITRLLGVHQYGLAATCVILMQLVIPIVSFGLAPAIQRSFASDGERQARTLVTLSLVLAAGGFVVASLTGPLWSPAVGLPGYSDSVQYAIAWGCLSAVTVVVLAVLRSKDKLRQFAVVSALQSVFAEALSLVLLLVVHRTSSEYLLGEVLGQVAALGVGLCFVRPMPMRRGDGGIVRSALAYGMPLIPALLASFVMNTSDRLVVNADLGHVAAARYAVANNVGSICLILMSQLADSWMPRVFAIVDDANVRSVMEARRNALYVVLVPATLALAIASPLLLRLWAPPSFRPDGLQLTAILVAVSAFPLAAVLSGSQSLMREARTRSLATIGMACAALNLALNLAIVPLVGIAGSAAATLATTLAYGLLVVFAGSKSTRLRQAAMALRIIVVVAFGACFASILLPVSFPVLLGRGGAAILCSLLAIACVAALGSRMGRLRVIFSLVNPASPRTEAL